MTGRPRNPGDLPPREAMKRFLSARRADRRDSSIESYHYRLKLWVEWCEGVGIERVGDLDGWDFDTYRTVRSGEGLSPSTLKAEMQTLKKLVEYLEQIEAVDEGLADKIDVPTVPKYAESDETMLEQGDAMGLLEHMRSDSYHRAMYYHAFLELAWHTGARVGGIRSLDLRDYYSHPDDQSGPYVAFHHRPDTGTPLKNGVDGERPVAFPREVAEVLDEYIQENRWDRHDENGRQPLFTSMQGRPEPGTLRIWCYKGTWPCIHTDCPHGKDPKNCPYKNHSSASQCPSSRSPHQVRTGSITWQRDLGFPPEVVSERVNASPDTIKKYYDKASALERLEMRRRPYIDRMEVDQE